jgi:hypothetical protein
MPLPISLSCHRNWRCRRERHAEKEGSQQAWQAQVEEQALGEFVLREALEGQEASRRVTPKQGREEEEDEQGGRSGIGSASWKMGYNTFGGKHVRPRSNYF